jgi:LysR family nitrogen assimilation transcriptional regulator
MWKEMTPKQLGFFLVVCAEGSISAAARKLNLAQPALSKHMAALEGWVGGDLFERHSRGIVLTEAGRRLQSEAADLIGRFEALKDIVGHENVMISGVVRIAILTSLGPAIMTQLVRTLAERYPGIDVNVSECTSVEAGDRLRSGLTDLAILPLSSAGHGSSMFTERFCLLAPSDRSSSSSPIRVEELTGLPMVVARSGYDMRQRIESCTKDKGVELDIRHQVDSATLLGSYIEHGLGYGIAPPTFWLNRIEQGAIIARQITDPYIERTIAVASPHAKGTHKAADVVQEIIIGLVPRLIAAGKLAAEPL